MAKFLKFIVNTVMIVAIVVAASLLVPPLAGVTTLIVDDIEMDTNLETGSVTYAWGVAVEELKVGDKVLLQEDADMVYLISAIESAEDGTNFVLEDKLSTDEEMITRQLQGVVDKVILTVPALGYVSMALRTVEGLIIVGLSVVFVTVPSINLILDGYNSLSNNIPTSCNTLGAVLEVQLTTYKLSKLVKISPASTICIQSALRGSGDMACSIPA